MTQEKEKIKQNGLLINNFKYLCFVCFINTEIYAQEKEADLNKLMNSKLQFCI